MCRHHVQARHECCVPQGSQLMSYVARCQAHTTSDMLRECEIDDHWNVDGDQVLARAVDRFILLNTTPPSGDMWSEWMLTELQATLSPKHICPEIWKLDKARMLRRIYYIDPENKVFDEMLKNSQKLEMHVDSAKPCKLRKTSGSSSQGGASGPRCGKSYGARARRSQLQSPPQEKGAKLGRHTIAKLTSPRESALRGLRTKIMEITLPKEGSILGWCSVILCTNLSPYSRHRKFWKQKPLFTESGVSKRGKNLKKKVNSR